MRTMRKVLLIPFVFTGYDVRNLAVEDWNLLIIINSNSEFFGLSLHLIYQLFS